MEQPCGGFITKLKASKDQSTIVSETTEARITEDQYVSRKHMPYGHIETIFNSDASTSLSYSVQVQVYKCSLSPVSPSLYISI